MKKYAHFLVVLLALFPASASAQVRNAACCSTANVQAQVDASSNGDIVTMAAGDWTFSGGVDLGSKSITIIGSGPGVTNISAANRAFGTSGYTKSHVDISGMTITNGDGEIKIQLLNVGTESNPSTFRIHNIRFYNGGADIEIKPWAGSNPPFDVGSEINGLIDNCTFITYGTGQYRTHITNNGHMLHTWNQPYAKGTDNAVFVENNTFDARGIGRTLTEGAPTLDTTRAGRGVFRFNAIYNHYIGNHGDAGTEDRGAILGVYF